MRTPEKDCRICPRLAEFRTANRAAHPTFFNAPVPSFGEAGAEFLIVGLAPGLRGANRSGRPFTGDHAGDLLYATLLDFGFAVGAYGADPGDGLRLNNCRITNAVRCVPPQNKPVGAEETACRPFLKAELTEGPAPPRVVLCLGGVAHRCVLAALGQRQSAFRFGHGARHDIETGLTLFDSYHCSRYNTNTGRLTPDMFRAVFSMVRAHLAGRQPAA